MSLRHLKLPFTFGALALLLGAPTLQGCGDDDGDAPAASAGTANGGTANSGLAGADSADGGGDDSPIVGNGGTTGGTQNDGAGGNPDNGAAGTPGAPSEGGASNGVQPGVGGAAPDQESLCEKFCDDEAVTCTGDLEQYPDRATCLSECSGWALGFVDDTAGNTVYCRIYHLGVASTDSGSAALHCPHTGAHPNSFCLD